MMVLGAPTLPPPLVEPAISLVRSSRNPLALSTTDQIVKSRWKSGIAYLPESDAALTTSAYCVSSSLPKAAQPAVVEWQPVSLDAEATCSPFGWEDFDFKGRASRRLLMGTPKAVEAEFWSGAEAQAAGWDHNLWLAMPSVAQRSDGHGPIDLTPGSPVSIKRAFEMLEQAIADQGLGTQGMIHCRPQALPQLSSLRRNGALILSMRDTIVVPGVGYPNLGPGGVAVSGTSTWLYATGMTDVWLEDPKDILYTPDPDSNPNWMAEGLDRSINTVTVYAHRQAMATWDGQCHFAVEATIDT